ncbi:hypothetical protein ABH994_001405 [Bradyrhizobium yuanmingense]|uniref:hypothetical protein n=1 Tax=Bradyrhizobium yuanmingense TaxID=108015 RepID=UPI0012FD9F10|nr:hypothetical protein [Bradyrhizobium yuanmingense]
MRRPVRMKELQNTQATLARLRVQRTEIDAEISRLEAVQEAQVTQVVIEKVKALGIAGLPIAQVLAGLDKIIEGMPQVSPASKDGYSECDEHADIATFVRLSRNASPANRHALESAGLHWNGRAGGWTGLITATALGRLRTEFGARVEKPELANAGESSAGAQRGDVDSLSSTEAERLMTPSETAMEQGGSLGSDPAAHVISPALHTSPFQRLPLRHR